MIGFWMDDIHPVYRFRDSPTPEGQQVMLLAAPSEKEARASFAAAFDLSESAMDEIWQNAPQADRASLRTWYIETGEGAPLHPSFEGCVTAIPDEPTIVLVTCTVGALLDTLTSVETHLGRPIE